MKNADESWSFARVSHPPSLRLPPFPRFPRFLVLLLLPLPLLPLSLPVNSPPPPPPGRFVSALLPCRTLSSSFFPRALAAPASQGKEREENLRDGVKVLREKRKLSLMAVFLERNT